MRTIHLIDRKTMCAAVMLAAFASVTAALPGKNDERPAMTAKARQAQAQQQFELANKYQSGEGVMMDRERALRLYTQAAQAGSAPAAYALARHYSGLTGQAVNLGRAHQYLRQAAQAGFAPAQTDLAFVYLNGNAEVAQDMVASLRWFRAAAKSGNVRAWCQLGDFYKHGWGGIKPDAAAAVRLYRATANADDPCASKSQYELYLAHLRGEGARADGKAAIDWLRRAADAGNPRAQRALGRAYERGEGVSRDPALARVWLRKSREGVAPHDDHEHDLPSFGGPGLFKRLAPFSPQAPSPKLIAP
ncbi:TPR repeat protein [Variovorax paradoxus]|uniref:tetratricopeptide repeat protein n=1 Tax=Variovorax paradoxus TaxID=34073 RepID=UPI002782EA78|nr:tetratricopeptide repeat protein [Variovorax paradoxus]MDP9962902.1 TPR repeat protein [Variovorax paradoxus]